jgi:HSP20 family molecular chaperone IbpA
MTDDTDPNDDGPFDRLKRLIETLEGLSEGSGNVETDFDVSVGSLDDATRRGPPSGSKRTRHPSLGGDRDRGRDRGGGDRVTVDADDLDPADAEYHVDVHEADDRVELRADLPGVAPDEVDVDVDGGEVVVTVGGEVVERVPTRWDAGTVVETSFNNGVLFVELERGDPEEGADR